MNLLKAVLLSSIVSLQSLHAVGNLISIDSDAAFQKEIMKKNAIVVVDFYAEWCGPCKTMKPRFEQAAEKLPDLIFAKVNIDLCPATAQSFSILSIPTFAVFKDGAKLGSLNGLCSIGDLVSFIQRFAH